MFFFPKTIKLCVILFFFKKKKQDDDKVDAKPDEKGDEGSASKSSKETETKMDVDSNANDNQQDESQCFPSGKFKLVSVLTHKGRTADSGHYVAWVLQGEKWVSSYMYICACVQQKGIVDFF